MVDLDNRETVTVYTVYTVYPNFAMNKESENLFMREEVARDHLEDLKKEAIANRKEKISKWEEELEGDLDEIEGIDMDPRELKEARIKTTKDEIEILESDDHQNENIPLGSLNSGETYPLITKIEAIK